MLRRIGGENFDGPINALAETSADLSRFTVEYPYGDVLSRPGLDLPLRQLCTVSMLLADGSAQPQLKFHIAGFLNAGGTPKRSSNCSSSRSRSWASLQPSMPSASSGRYSPNASWHFSPSSPRRVTERDADGPDARCWSGS
ncbi:carboxymuconolactone decarboxylase family protein [Mesorhizobium sp. M0400]|uniref:carboxymuconolactone decarboxylase family protein n=1 Tax=Mesorhizobium sp. M0400 TaxID=2956941 RepID=UPI003339058A